MGGDVINMRQITRSTDGALLVGAIASAFLIGPIVKRIGERNAMVLGLSLAATSALVIALAYTGSLFLLSVPIASLGGLLDFFDLCLVIVT